MGKCRSFHVDSGCLIYASCPGQVCDRHQVGNFKPIDGESIRNVISMIIVSCLSGVFCVPLHLAVEILCIDPPSIDTTPAT